MEQSRQDVLRRLCRAKRGKSTVHRPFTARPMDLWTGQHDYRLVQRFARDKGDLERVYRYKSTDRGQRYLLKHPLRLSVRTRRHRL